MRNLRHMLARCRCFATAAMAGCLAGCSSGYAPEPERYEPAAAAEAAIGAYDSDANQLLDEAELAACPALLNSIARLDQDRDGSLSANEIARRIEAHQQSDPKLVSVTFRIGKGAEPAAGLKISLQMEPFQGASLPVYTGETDANGEVNVHTPGAKLGGVLPPGFYSARLTPREGAETVIGLQIANDMPTSNGIVFLFLSL